MVVITARLAVVRLDAPRDAALRQLAGTDHQDRAPAALPLLQAWGVQGAGVLLLEVDETRLPPTVKLVSSFQSQTKIS